jgi:ABC-type sugar transport system ATPase subunit
MIKLGDVVGICGQTQQRMSVIRQVIFGESPSWVCGWVAADGHWQEVELPESILHHSITFIGKENLQEAIDEAWNKSNGR